MNHIHPYSDPQLVEMMRKASVRPSVQRLAVLEFVANSHSHPSADELYTHLHDKFPTLSRTTVYNSLHALVKGKLIRELEIESGNMRYDLAPQPSHGHFICKQCGKIYDTAMPHDVMSAMTGGFMIDSVDIFFKGLCPACITANNNSK